MIIPFQTYDASNLVVMISSFCHLFISENNMSVILYNFLIICESSI